MLQKMTFSAVLTLCAVLISACNSDLFGCNDAIGCVEIGPDEPVQIGYLLSLSGMVANLGQDSLGGIEIALDDRGDLLGHEIVLVGEDSKCTLEGGQEGVEELLKNPDIVSVIGTSCSSAATAALPFISSAGWLMISSSNTAPALTNPQQSWEPGYFRTAHNDLTQGRLAAEFAFIELGAKTAATVHDGSPYSEALQAVFADVFTQLGGQITSQASLAVGQTDMEQALTDLATEAPDILYLPIFEPEGNYIVQQARAISGLEDSVLMGADGLLTASFGVDTGRFANGMFLSGPYVQNVQYSRFLDKWMLKYSNRPPSGFHAHAYDATNILLDAIESVAQVGSDGSLTIGRQALRDAIADTANYDGLSGRLSCNEFGDCATGEALAIYRITPEVLAGNFPPPVEWIR